MARTSKFSDSPDSSPVKEVAPEKSECKGKSAIETGISTSSGNFNADNRRISEILREARSSAQMSDLKAQNRKLKMEVARLQQELSNFRS